MSEFLQQPVGGEQPSRWAKWHRTAWARLLAVACLSFQPAALCFLPIMQPMRTNGVIERNVLNFAIEIVHFMAVGAAGVGVLFLGLASICFIGWLRADPREDATT